MEKLWLEPLLACDRELQKQSAPANTLLIMVDAIDELQDEGKSLIGLLRAGVKAHAGGAGLLSRLPAWVHLFITSTNPLPDWACGIAGVHARQWDASSSENEGDLLAYAAQHVTALSGADVKLQEERVGVADVAAQLARRSDGIFVHLSFSCQVLDRALAESRPSEAKSTSLAQGKLQQMRVVLASVPVAGKLDDLYQWYLHERLQHLENQGDVHLHAGLLVLQFFLGMRHASVSKRLLLALVEHHFRCTLPQRHPLIVAEDASYVVNSLSSLFEPRKLANPGQLDAASQDGLVFHQSILRWMWHVRDGHCDTKAPPEPAVSDEGCCPRCVIEQRRCDSPRPAEGMLQKMFAKGWIQCDDCGHEWTHHSPQPVRRLYVAKRALAAIVCSPASSAEEAHKSMWAARQRS